MNKVSDIIYQIGRLDSQMKPLTFEFEGKTYENKDLTSLALKEHFGNNTKVILIYPVSLPFNRTLIGEQSKLQQEFKEKIEWVLNNKNEYFQNPKEFFEVHPHTKKVDDFIVVHSIGEYAGERFEGTYDDIVIEILFDMIERYLENRFSELYIDISSGLNIYISALLEAARHFSVFDQLRSWNSERCKIYKVFSEPIMGFSADSYRIYKIPMEFKVFYSSPIKKRDIDNYELPRMIVRDLFGDIDNRELKREIHKYFENFGIHFSAIKNATPLANYTFEFDEICSIEGLLKKIISLGKDKLGENWLRSPQLSKEHFLKTLLSLSFYEGIVKILGCKGVNQKGKEGISLGEIEKFKEIYEVFGLSLNISFLGNEIWNLSEARDKDDKRLVDKVSENWEELGKFLYGDGGSRGFNRRNFFAHAGFERNVTEVMKRGEKLYFRYNELAKEEIKNALLEQI